MTKIKDFIKSKLHNFKKFLLEQIDCLNKNNIQYNRDGIKKLLDELDFYTDNLEQFIAQISTLNKNTDDNIKLFLLNYSVNVDDLKYHIDYDKLKRYIDCFIDCIKN